MSTRYFGGIIRKTPLALDPALGNAANGVFTMSQYMQAVKDGTWPGFDPYFNQTVLSLHGNGTNGDQNNTFLDSSTNNFTITRNGNTTQGTFSPYGDNWSNYFDGTGDYLTAPDNAAFDLANDYTLEFWWYPTDLSGSTNILVIGNQQSAQNGLVIYWNSFVKFYSNGADVITSSIATAANQWHHIALVRNGGGSNNTTLYINGTSAGTATNTTSFTGVAGNGLAINATYDGSFFAGKSAYFSNVRLVKGTAVYTAAFTPPTAPLTAITNTSLLTCQSNRFVDNSTNAFAITRNGDVRVTPFSPFAPTAAYSAGTNGGSGYFDGNGDYLSIPDNDSWVLGNNFTIECWVYFNSTSGIQQFINQRSSSSNAWQFLYNFPNSGDLTFKFEDGNVAINRTWSPTVGQWYHIAVTRDGSTWYLFVNGVQLSTTATNSTTFPNISATVWVGTLQNPTVESFVGYMCDMRVVKSSVRTTAFTPPTAPLTAIANTQLLLNFTNAGIIDNTGKNNLETVGNAQIDTTTKKYGTGSMEFDGTGDWLLMPNTPDQQLGTGNFTIEFWVYLASGDTGSARGLVAKGGASTGWLVSLDSSQKVVFTYTTSTITSSGAITTNAWNHIAVVREGTGSNQTKIYISGTNDGTGTVSTDFNQTESMYVGANRTGGDAMKGFIDDLRITKGVARYTSNFTPQTSQWQDQ